MLRDPKPFTLQTRPKLHKAYPLTRFRDYLATTASLSPGTVPPYLSSIRKLLAALQEGHGGRSKTWLDAPAVAAHFETLPYNTRQIAKQALAHWLTFTTSPPGHNLAPRASRAEAVFAFRLLLNYRGAGFPQQPFDVLASMRWARSRHDGTTLVLTMQGDGEAEWHLAPGLKEMGALIRSWAKCGVGDPLLPVHPNSKIPMDQDRVQRFVQGQVSPPVAARVLALVEDAEKKALARHNTTAPTKKATPHVTPPERFRVPPAGLRIPDPDDEGPGYKVYGRCKDAKVVYDRDPEYEDYVVPLDCDPSELPAEDESPADEPPK